jgi:PKD repeat protein
MTPDSTPRTRRPFRPLTGLALVVIAGTVAPATRADTVSGTVRYADQHYSYNPGNGQLAITPQWLPVRQAEVEIVRADNATLGSGVTDDAGGYTVTVANAGSQSIFLRVYARRADPAHGIHAVVKATSSRAIYAYATAAAARDTDAPVTIGCDIPAGSSSAFNIFDVAVLSFQFLGTLGATVTNANLLTLYWESGTTAGTYTDTDTNSIYLLGRSTDSDDFDDDIILHELGHYVAVNFAKDDSPGGSHTITGHYIITLTWSEGWAHFWSSSVRQWAVSTPAVAPPGTAGDRYPQVAWLIDTRGSGSPFAYDIGTPTPAVSGADNELSVGAALWDIAADAGAGGTLGLGVSGIWHVFHDRFPLRASLPVPDHFVTFEDFFDEWNGAGYASLDAVLAARTIRYVADAREANDSPGTAAPLDPLPASAGAGKTLALNTFFKTGAVPVGDEDWFSFTAFANQTFRIETLNLGDGADTFLHVYDPSLTEVASNDDRAAGTASSLVQFTTAVAGTFSIQVAPYPGHPPYPAADQVATYGYYDLRITPVTTGVTVTVPTASGSAPFAAEFTVDPGTNRASLYRYQWDFDGDGRFDYDDPAGGSVRHVYTRPGTYAALLRMTSGAGVSVSMSVTITVTAASPPTVTATPSSTVPGAAPQAVTFSASVAGGTAVLYEWDFDGDGVFDSLHATDPSPLAHTYTAAGTYVAVLRVTDDQGRTFTATTPAVTVDAPALPPSVTLTPDVSGGVIPFPLTLTADAGFGRYDWDVDGDGRDELATAASSVTVLVTRVGAFAPRVRATDASNRSATATAAVAATAAGTAGWIEWPVPGRTVSGNAVAVAARAVPAGVAKTVQIEASTDGGSTWTPVGPDQAGTGTFFAAAWDTSAIPDGTPARLRVLVNGAGAPAATVTGLTVNSVSPDTIGTVAAGLAGGQAWIDPAALTGAWLSDDAGLRFPLGSLAGGGGAAVLFARNTAVHLPGGSTEGLVQVGLNYGFAFDVAPSLGGRFRLRIRFADADGDGLVDGTRIAARTLAIHYYDTGGSTWRRDLASDVSRDGNWVETDLWHFTDFGVFGSETAAAPAGGGGHHRGCGSIGLDLMAPLVLLGLLRRRREGRRRTSNPA